MEFLLQLLVELINTQNDIEEVAVNQDENLELIEVEESDNIFGMMHFH